MPQTAPASLLDDRQFLDELAHIETRPSANVSAQPGDSVLDDLDEGLPLKYLQLVAPAAEESAVSDTRPSHAPLEAPSASANDSRNVGALVGAFVLLMCVGAAGAALVFHQRIADIIALMR